ncbi:uncharacterized protein N7518_007831 [Penicillium psychrosexuale]|uniref:uncharacterized protein n=1 Tax=Penicillium psychrosexuale TaxID=1002107 RepID=UPI00254557EF|nr:uncharacterized protein N7518_007831 [Penicillium psychrosexuale]KAJ5790820.1 hypothetical protein N7518_007831 [Penicillium psychrosexuale]
MEIHRRIQFEGNDTAYIRFLEAKVLELERILLSSLESHSPAPQSIEAGGNQRPSSRQYHTNEPANQSRGFQVIEYDPTRIDRAPTEKPSNSQTRLRWQSDLDSLLAKIPPLGHWRSNKQKFLEDGEITLRILSHADTLSYQPPRFSQQTSSEIVGLVPILHQYCDFAMKTSPEGDFYRKLVCFRELVFMSFCAVTLKTVGDAASVFEVMREYSGHDAQEKHLIKLTRGAIWANRSIFALSETQWRSDCSDIFLQGESE